MWAIVWFNLSFIGFFNSFRGFRGHDFFFSLFSFLPSRLTFNPGLRYIQPMAADPQIVLCTVPDEDTAENIATTLVNEKLAACVNIVPGITSVYRWKGGIERDRELLLLIKSGQGVYPDLEDRIRALHPYELPEVIAVPIGSGLPEYLDWIINSLKTTS